jgi:hypoxanthine phosphoribosyltransferase
MTNSDHFEVLIDRDAIRRRVTQLGEQIAADYAGRDLVMVGVLKGSVFFLSDLVRAIDAPVEIDFISVASYGSETKSSGVVRMLKDLDSTIEGRDVLLVEDIVDTGLTLSYLVDLLERRHPNSIGICTLLDKPERRHAHVDCKYVGFEIPNQFVVGYGLDYAERFRNLDYIAVLDESNLPVFSTDKVPQ